MLALVLFGMFFVLIAFNIPIAVSLGLSTLVGVVVGGFPLQMFPTIFYSAMGKFALLAIPFFILAGVIMDYAGISKRLIDFARVAVGHRKSGLVSVVVIVACFFAAISGSGPATVAALGSVLIPAMVAAGYDIGMASALLSASGSIGIIIPPSIAYIVYASIADVSVGKMFAAGIIPGIVVGIAYVIVAIWISRNNKNIVKQEKASTEEFWKAFKGAIWGLITPVIILGGIYSGVFTPTEAAGVAVVYSLIVGIFIYKEIKIRDLKNLFFDAAISSGTVMYIIACASVFAWLLTASHIASDLSAGMLSISSNKYVILALINIVFLIAGCFLDAASAFYILLPIMLPIVRALEIDPIQFGIFITINLAIGLITPPVGINLYVACNIAKIPVSRLIQKIGPFVVAGIVALLLVTYIPAIAQFLPNIIYK